ncbi:MAG TPA: hypothetical protein VN317_10370 [Candidatus Methanoperedens sp.]|nr:hypothetical protein [Candidatus Methanoperedens sp.]
MLIRRYLAGLVLLASGLLAGCASGSYSPFEGDWLSATAPSFSFDGSHWSDGNGNSGEFSFSGKYPTFVVVFRGTAGQFQRVATFADARTFELCEPGTGGGLINCHDFVFDKPTLH